jgi:hypothetical protein
MQSSHHIVAGFCVISMSGLAGCTNVPDLPSKSRIPISAVVDRVKCEIGEAMRRNLPANPWLDTWAGAFALTLRVETDTGATGTANWVIPWTPTSTFGIGFSGGAGTDATRTAVVKYVLPVNEFTQYRCLQPGDEANGELFVAQLGLADWLDRAIKAGDHTHPADQPTELDYTLEFAVALNAGVTPGFTFVNLTGSVNPTASRTDDDTLDLAFTDASPSAPMKVEVVNFPQGPAGGGAAGLRAFPRAFAVRPGTYPYKTVGPKGVDPDVKRRLDQILDNLRLQSALRR